ALLHNTTGHDNVASGLDALFFNTTGNNNLAAGRNALLSDTGGSNLAFGVNALKNNTTGASNVAIGTGAGVNLTTGSSNIDIANPGLATDTGQIRIGRTGVHKAAFLAGISGVSIPGPTLPVVINANGQLGTATSASAPRSDTSGLSAQVRRQQHQIDQLKA